MKYQIEKREVTTLKNYHGYPGYGKETRWYITHNGEDVKDENLTILWFYRKKDAKEYIEKCL